MKKQHIWNAEDDRLLEKAITDCKPIFEHFETQNKAYTKLNAWDAVAGRLLPDVCVTGAACKRRFEILQEQKQDKWKDAINIVSQYERELAETTFDGVTELLGEIDAMQDRLTMIENKLDTVANIQFDLLKIWK